MSQNTFNFHEICKTAEALKFEVIMQNETEIKVRVFEDWGGVFQNMASDETIIFFENNIEWHTHGELFKGSHAIACDDVPMSILLKGIEGEYLLIEQRISRTAFKPERSFGEKDEIIGSLKYREPGESMKIIRLQKKGYTLHEKNRGEDG